MKKVHIRNYILLIFASILLPACSLEKSEGESAVKQPVELVIRASQGGSTRAMENVDDVIEVGAELAPSTRTELGNGPGVNTNGDVNAGAEQQIRWVNDDQIMVWAEPAVSPQGYAFEQKVFSLAYYNHDFHSADFSAMVASTLDRDYDYTYYAIYPSPKYRNSQGQESAVSGITHNGTEITYTLSASQSGEYNPAYDIMWGKVTGAALIERDDSGSVDVWRQPELHMKHLLHMMRIRVPENRNLLGRDVKRLEITFPQAVVGGTAKVNVKTGEVVWSGQSNKVTIDLPDENLLNANGRYVWVQIKPGMLDGEISFQAYDSAGVPAAEIKSASINKTLSAGRITPVDLTIPSSHYGEGAGLKFIVEKNNLGEQLSNIILSADDYTFIKPFTTDIVSANSISLTPDNNNPQTFTVTVIGNPSSLGISYISAHASIHNRTIPLSTTDTKFEDTIIKVLDTPLQISKMNQAKMVVPYLFYEDFSNVSSHSYYDADWFGETYKAIDMGNVGLTGWTGAKWETTANTSLMVASYIGSSYRGTATDCENGRVDTKSLPLTTSGVSVNVSYMIGGKTDASNANNSCYFGTTTKIGGINGTTTYKNPATPDNLVDSYVINNGGNISELKSHIVNGCSQATRLTWCCNPTSVATGGVFNCVTSKYFYIYLDNIKVSIAN